MGGEAPVKEDAGAPGRWRALVLLSLAELLGMSLWFSAAAIVPSLVIEWRLNEASVGWLTIAVQLGFVCGTLISAFLNLPDVLSVRYLFAISALAGALSNAAFGAYSYDAQSAIVFRFLTGRFSPAFTAGDENNGDLVSTRTRHGARRVSGRVDARQSLPYLVNALGSSNWRQNFSLFHCSRSAAA